MYEKVYFYLKYVYVLGQEGILPHQLQTPLLVLVPLQTGDHV